MTCSIFIILISDGAFRIDIRQELSAQLFLLGFNLLDGALGGIVVDLFLHCALSHAYTILVFYRLVATLSMPQLRQLLSL